MRRKISICLVLVMLGLMVFANGALAEKKWKAAMLLSGPINDGGWNTAAYNGLEKIRTELGFEIAFTEMVKKSDQLTIARNYARNGFDVIYGHGFEFGDALKEISEEFPNVKFVNIGGGVSGENLASGRFVVGELAYLTGKLAALFTKTDKIGFVGAMEIPTIQGEVERIKETVGIYNPKATVTVAYTGSWVDINKGKEAALAQISNGVDVIIAIGDACDVGAIKAAQAKKDVYIIGWSGDFNALAPDVVLTSGVQSVEEICLITAQSVKDGTFVGNETEYGIQDGVQFFGTWSNSVPAELRELLMGDYEAIRSGVLDVSRTY